MHFFRIYQAAADTGGKDWPDPMTDQAAADTGGKDWPDPITDQAAADTGGVVTIVLTLRTLVYIHHQSANKH